MSGNSQLKKINDGFRRIHYKETKKDSFRFERVPTVYLEMTKLLSIINVKDPPNIWTDLSKGRVIDPSTLLKGTPVFYYSFCNSGWYCKKHRKQKESSFTTF